MPQAASDCEAIVRSEFPVFLINQRLRLYDGCAAGRSLRQLLRLSRVEYHALHLQRLIARFDDLHVTLTNLFDQRLSVFNTLIPPD